MQLQIIGFVCQLQWLFIMSTQHPAEAPGNQQTVHCCRLQCSAVQVFKCPPQLHKNFAERIVTDKTSPCRK